MGKKTKDAVPTIVADSPADAAHMERWRRENALSSALRSLGENGIASKEEVLDRARSFDAFLSGNENEFELSESQTDGSEQSFEAPTPRQVENEVWNAAIDKVLSLQIRYPSFTQYGEAAITETIAALKKA